MPGERTEKATPKRKQEERKKGNVLMSREVISIASLFGVFFALNVWLPFGVETILDYIRKFFASGATVTHLTKDDLAPFFFDAAVFFVIVAIPILLTAGLVTIIVTMAQTRMLFSTKAFAFKLEKLNPINGFKKMFAMRSAVELIKSVFKIIILVSIVYSVMKDEFFLLPRLFDMEPMQAMARVGELIFDIVVRVGIIFAFLAAADYLYQWWEYEKNLRMTKQEVKDEFKQMEGDPQVKGQIRNLQQRRARQRMMQNVPQADVVIRNPTHYAVALKYDREKDFAPIVVAKGADFVALRIIEIAEQNDVFVTENKPLARALFENVDIDTHIPSEFYQPIAEVLAFMYKIKNTKIEKQK